MISGNVIRSNYEPHHSAAICHNISMDGEARSILMNGHGLMNTGHQEKNEDL